MSLNQITFYKFKKDDMSGVESHNDFVDTTQLFLFPPNLFNIEAYEIDYYYTWVGGAEGDRYTPGTILDPEIDTMPEDGTEFYTAWKEGDRGYLALIYDDITIDISDLLLGANVTYGKNQPFPYGEVTISKQIFNSEEYWNSRIEMSAYMNESPPITAKPILLQGTTKVLIGVYGIKGEWEYQKVKDNNTVYTLVCAHPAHRLKDLKLDKMFEVKDYDPIAPSIKFPNLFGETPFALNAYPVSGTSPPMRKITNFAGSGADIYVEFGVPTSPTVSRIEGSHASIFKLLVHLGLGTDYTDMKVDGGMTHISAGYDFQSTYSSSEMDDLKAVKSPLSTNSKLTTTSIRAQGNAWETILSLGYMVNAEVFFYDKAYFVDYLTPDKVVDKLLLNYGNEAESGWTTEEVLNIVENKDQGSQAIQTSQTVFSENYSTSITVSEGGSTLIEGTDVKYLYPDSLPRDDKIYQIKTIALNLLLKNYLPGDVVSYSVSEIKRADVQYEDIAGMQAGLPGVSVGTIAQVGTGYFSDYYICTLNEAEVKIWKEYSFNISPQRNEKYPIYSIANNIRDTQNSLELTDIKLALTQLSYPSCTTAYIWGNPEFLDTEQAITDVEMGVADATISGTDDTLISDKYSALMVYGNIGVSELPEDINGVREDFTGMILEKNWDREQYRFVGYKEGYPQAMFNTDGKIEAGGGDVIMDEEGLTVYFDPEAGEYVETNAFKFRSKNESSGQNGSNYDASRIYITNEELEDEIKRVTNIRAYNEQDGGEGIIRIFNTDSPSESPRRNLASLGLNMGSSSPELESMYVDSFASVDNIHIMGGENNTFNLHFGTALKPAPNEDHKSVFQYQIQSTYLMLVTMNISIVGEPSPLMINVVVGANQKYLITYPIVGENHPGISQISISLSPLSPSLVDVVLSEMFVFHPLPGGTIEVLQNKINLNGDINLNGVLGGTFDLGFDFKQNFINSMLSTIANNIYPVGSIYISVLDSSPALLFGVGTWVRYGQGRVLVGVNEDDESFDMPHKIGGAKTHKLTLDEMPEHAHEIPNQYGGSGYWHVGGGGGNSGTTGSMGGSLAHNNLQPYITVYMWRRTA